jgi:hypothetical protein
VEKPQLRIPEESVRQNSFELAAAGVAIATNASANSVVAGAAVKFKNCFILFFPVFGSAPETEMGSRRCRRHRRRKIAMQFSGELLERSKRRAPISFCRIVFII